MGRSAVVALSVVALVAVIFGVDITALRPTHGDRYRPNADPAH